MAAISTVDHAFRWLNTGDAAKQALLAEIGGGSTPALRDLVYIKSPDWDHAISSIMVPIEGRDPRAPTPIELGHFAMVRRIARLRCGLTRWKCPPSFQLRGMGSTVQASRNHSLGILVWQCGSRRLASLQVLLSQASPRSSYHLSSTRTWTPTSSGCPRLKSGLCSLTTSVNGGRGNLPRTWSLHWSKYPRFTKSAPQTLYHMQILQSLVPTAAAWLGSCLIVPTPTNRMGHGTGGSFPGPLPGNIGGLRTGFSGLSTFCWTWRIQRFSTITARCSGPSVHFMAPKLGSSCIPQTSVCAVSILKDSGARKRGYTMQQWRPALLPPTTRASLGSQCSLPPSRTKCGGTTTYTVLPFFTSPVYAQLQRRCRMGRYSSWMTYLVPDHAAGTAEGIITADQMHQQVMAEFTPTKGAPSAMLTTLPQDAHRGIVAPSITVARSADWVDMGCMNAAFGRVRLTSNPNMPAPPPHAAGKRGGQGNRGNRQRR